MISNADKINGASSAKKVQGKSVKGSSSPKPAAKPAKVVASDSGTTKGNLNKDTKKGNAKGKPESVSSKPAKVAKATVPAKMPASKGPAKGSAVAKGAAKASASKVIEKAGKAKVAPASPAKDDSKKSATPSKNAVSKMAPAPVVSKVMTPKMVPAKTSPKSEKPKGVKADNKKLEPKTASDVGSSSKSKSKEAVSKGNDKGSSAVRVSPPMKATVSHPPKAKSSPPVKPTNPKVVKKIRELQSSKEQRKDLSQDIFVPEVGFHGTHDINHDPQRDRMILVVRDSYWLHASWEITRRSVDRAKAAMAEYWHTVRPVLRVLKIDNSGTTNNSETILRDIEIHGGVRNWYIDVIDPPSSFRVLLGYVAGADRFHELVRSNIVTTPIPGSDEAISTHWADIAKDAERIFALSGGYSDDRETKDLQEMFEDHLKRPMGAPALAQFGNGAEGGIRRHRNFHFDLDAEMVVFGSTHPDAYVTLGGEPVKVQSDGTFSVRVPLPDRRQVLPATACTRDGVDEQTIVIAVERNTKVMEPLSKENEEQ